MSCCAPGRPRCAQCAAAMGQDDFSYTIDVHKNEPQKDPNWMPIVVIGGVAALMLLWWRKA